MVYFEDEKGKPHRQLYALVEPGVATPLHAVRPVAAQPVPPEPSALSKAEDALRSAVSPAAKPAGTVKCNFLSAPPGAEIELDGHYVGSTPSILF